MPFKLRLKKSRQYNVVSKSLFVICIELLDSSSTECTLTSESTGRECLENVCQRLGLQQTEFFGLRYISKNNSPRWIELERPLKRQLDKYAKDNSLYLRVMFYVNNGIQLINDEMTRYHYFLQLKNDIIEGRIQTNLEEAVLLASYCMQAEFGNYNLERHTFQYLKDFALFPKDILEDDPGGNLLERLTDATIQQHSNLVGLSQSTAEEYYIVATQQLDGYGQETFLVKNEHGLETILGITLKGIIIQNTNSTKFYKWADIANVLNHKKNFGIETSTSENIVNFIFPDVESAKYVFRMCVHQHTFYMSYEVNEDEEERNSSGGRSLFQNIDSAMLSSHEELDEIVPNPMRRNLVANINNRDGIVSTTSYPHSRDVVDSHEYRSNLDLVETNQDKFNSHQELDKFRTSHQDVQDLDKLRSLLPSYRPAPDYQTAILQKYKTEQHAQLYSSHPEIANSYPDVTQHYTNNNVLHTTYSIPDLEKHMYMLHMFKSPPPYPIGSNSTPDLASQSTPDLALNMSHAQQMNFQQVSGSSPDLVSSRNQQQRSQYQQHYSDTHRTYANLANVVQQQQMFDEKGMLYHPHYNNNEANNMLLQYLKTNSAAANNVISNSITSSQSVSNRPVGTNLGPKDHEPIYENVPLPWKHQHEQKTNLHRTNSSEPRAGSQSRKSSTTSAKVAFEEMPNKHRSERSNSVSTDFMRSAYDRLSSEKRDRLLTGESRIPENRPLGTKVDIKPPLENVHSVKVDIEQTGKNINEVTHINIPGTSNINKTVINTSDKLASDKVDGKTVITLNDSTKSAALTKNSSSTVVTSQAKSSSGQNKTVSNESSSNKPIISSNINADFTRNVQNITSSSSLHAYYNIALDTSNHSTAESTITSSSTNTSTAEKKKKKWSGFLSSDKSSKSSKSSTLPRFDEKKSKNKVISKEAMCQILEKKLSDQQLFFEFEKIPKVPKTNPDFTSAQHVDNLNKNRFKDIIPYEENRVRLSAKLNNKLGYINASHITASVGNEQRFYIAAQTPLTNTIDNFWDMIWETNVYLVVYLAESSDSSYVPNNINKTIDIGEFRISKEFTQETGHCVTCKLKLTNINTKRSRSVWHLFYSNWNLSNNTPNSVSHFLGFLEEISSIREHIIVTEIPVGHNKNPPILVHCLCGVEKTGVTILSDLLLYMLDHNEETDIPRLLLSLRNQRMKLVSNIVQYTFVYNLLVYYLKHSRLI